MKRRSGGNLPSHHLASLLDLTCSRDRNAEAGVPKSNPQASQDQELRTDRSLTYFDDVAAIKVSLQLMQKRSGVPLLQLTSTLKFLHPRPFTPTTHIQAGCEAYVTPFRANPSLCEEP